jgi:hypothetical protein
MNWLEMQGLLRGALLIVYPLIKIVCDAILSVP